MRVRGSGAALGQPVVRGGEVVFISWLRFGWRRCLAERFERVLAKSVPIRCDIRVEAVMEG